MINNIKSEFKAQPYSCEAHQELFQEKIDEILNNYKIDPHSKLAHIIDVSLRKMILGFDEKLKTYDAWYQAHGKAIGRTYRGLYPYQAIAHTRKYDSEGISKAHDQFLKIDMGRHAAASNIEQLIIKHQDDIKVTNFQDPPRRVLGSITIRAMRIHSFKANNGIEVSLDMRPERKAEEIKRFRKERVLKQLAL